jgi:chaperonin GroES
MDFLPIGRIATARIAPPRAEEYKSESGLEISLVIGSHNEDVGYWTNNHFEVLSDGFGWLKGDKVLIRYDVAGDMFGHYGDKKSEGDVGVEMPDGRKAYFFKPEEVVLGIRNDVLIAPMGRCIVTQIEKQEKSILLEHKGEQQEENKYMVVCVGEPTPEEKLPMTNTNKATTFRLTEVFPKAGDVIVTQNGFGIPVESPLNKKLDKEYWCVDLHRVLGVWSEEYEPLGDRLLVTPEDAPDKTNGGLFIPKIGKDVKNKGIVRKVGANCEISVGQRVYFGKHSGLRDGDALLLREQDILCYEI